MIPQYAHVETLIDTKWLSKHLADPQIRIIEMGLSSDNYKQGHIPGTVFWEVNQQIQFDSLSNLDIQEISALLRATGITKDTTVIAIHDTFPASSGAIFWLLKLLGHADVRILNGGRPKWILDGYPLTAEPTTVQPTDYPVTSFDDSLKISLAEVQTSINHRDRIILDVRTPEEYDGEIFMLQPPTANERAGHIPSAINFNYELAHNEDGTFKSAAELQVLFQQRDITPDKLIIPYCAVGARSGHTWFILKYLLGYPQVKNYNGSWNQWSRVPDLAIAK